MGQKEQGQWKTQGGWVVKLGCKKFDKRKCEGNSSEGLGHSQPCRQRSWRRRAGHPEADFPLHNVIRLRSHSKEPIQELVGQLFDLAIV